MFAAAAVAMIVIRPAPRAPSISSEPAYAIPGVEQTLKVEILNGTSRDGLARTATRQLRREGFDVVYYGSTDDSVRRSQVIARRVDARAARAVASELGIDSIVAIPDTTRRVDVSVWLGLDYHPKPDLHP